MQLYYARVFHPNHAMSLCQHGAVYIHASQYNGSLTWQNHQAQEIIAFLILERLYREMASLPDSPINEETGNRQIRTCIVIDEAHHYLGRNNEFLDKLIREGRSKGFVVILSSQSPKDYRQKFDYGQFIENKFIFKCQVNKGELQNLIKSDDATAARMVQEVMNLPKGDCLFNHSTSSKQSFTRLRASQFHEAYQAT